MFSNDTLTNTDIAKAAGYSKESAYNQGYRLSQNAEVKERIFELEQELETNVDGYQGIIEFGNGDKNIEIVITQQN